MANSINAHLSIEIPTQHTFLTLNKYKLNFPKPYQSPKYILYLESVSKCVIILIQKYILPSINTGFLCTLFMSNIMQVL